MFDTIILVAYFLCVSIIGIIYGKKIKDFKDFAVANKNYSLSVMLATLFATVIGGGSTFGVSTKVFSTGIVFLIAFYGAVVNKLIVARYVAPQFDNRYTRAISIGDIMGNHYGKWGKILTGLCITLVSIGSVGSQVAAVGFTLEYLLQIPFIIGVMIGFGILIFYSAFGGIRSVVATDVFQFILILTFIPIIFFIGLDKTGGFVNLFKSLPAEKLSLYPDTPIFLKSLTMFCVMSLSALDPSFIHRLLISKTGKQAADITRLTGYLSLPFFTIMGILGLISFHLNPSLPPEHALAFLVDDLLPTGLKGLAVVGLLSALMSTADSDLHILGVSLVQDVILPFKKNQVMNETKKLALARLLTALLGIGSVGIALYFKNIINIMIYAFSFWGPTVLVPFIFCLYNKIFTKKQFISGVSLGALVVLFWNLFLENLTHLDGFIPGMFTNIIYFLYLINKHKKYDKI